MRAPVQGGGHKPRKPPVRGPQGLPGPRHATGRPKPSYGPQGLPGPRRPVTKPKPLKTVRVQQKRKAARRRRAINRADVHEFNPQVRKAQGLAHYRALERKRGLTPKQLLHVIGQAIDPQKAYGVSTGGGFSLPGTLNSHSGALAAVHPGIVPYRGPVGSLIKHFGSDVVSLGTSPFVAGYQIGAGAVDIAKGKGAGRLERLGKGIVKGTADTFIHPKKSFTEHPLTSLLTFAGAEGAIGRTGGALARGAGAVDKGAARAALARAGSTTRSPLALTDLKGSRILHERKPFSKDPIRKAAQVAVDRRTRQDAGYTVVRNGRPVKVLKSHTHQIPHRSERERLIDRRTDYVASRANSTNRLVRERAAHDTHKMRPKARAGKHPALDREIVPHALQGTARRPDTILADLKRRRDTIQASVDRTEQELKKAKPDAKSVLYRTKVELAAAKEEVRTIDRFLASKPTPERIQRVFASRDQLAQRINANDKAMVQAKLGKRKQLDRSRLFPYAQEHMGATYEDGSLKVNGETVTTRQIKDHMRAHGVDPAKVAYLPHRTDVRGARAFYSQFRGGNRPVVKNEPRTGALYARGAASTRYETAADHVVRQETQLAKADAVDQFIRDHGVKHPDGRYFTSAEAKDAAQKISSDTGEKWTPVSAVPAKLDRQLQEAVKQGQDPRAIEDLSSQIINSRLDAGRKGSAKNVVLIPQRMVDRLAKHVQPAGDLERMVQFVNRPFRFTVLSQPRWLAGQFVEPYLVRLPMHGSGIFLPGLAVDLRAWSRIVGRDATAVKIPGTNKSITLLKEIPSNLPKPVRDQLKAELEGGLLIGNRGASNYRTIQDLPGIVGQAGKVAHIPVIKQFGWLTKKILTTSGHAFFGANRYIEAFAQRAALGHIARHEVQEFTGSWTAALKMGDKAAQDAAKGLFDTANQQRFAARMDEMLGKYSRWSPTTRRLTQTVLPFIPWSMAAARFVFWTLPAHHTVKTALLVHAGEVNHQAWLDAHKSIPPYAQGSLNEAVPNGKGGFVDVSRYTPFGFSAPLLHGDTGNLGDAFLPQFASLLNAAHGKDPFGNDYPKGTNRTVAAANTLLGDFVPLYSQVTRLREGGATGKPDSTPFSPKTKPGTKHGMSAFRRTFDPFRPIYFRTTGKASQSISAAIDDPEIQRALNLSQQREAKPTGALADPEIQAALKRLKARP